MQRQFTSAVQVVSASQQDEFFAGGSEAATEQGASPVDSGAAEAAGGGAAGELGGRDALPTAEWVLFNAAGLQALLAEGCLYGWHLWGAEAGARAHLKLCGGDATAAALLTPPAWTADEEH